MATQVTTDSCLGAELEMDSEVIPTNSLEWLISTMKDKFLLLITQMVRLLTVERTLLARLYYLYSNCH